jgi:hypothetical protein
MLVSSTDRLPLIWLDRYTNGYADHLSFYIIGYHQNAQLQMPKRFRFQNKSIRFQKPKVEQDI